MASDTTNVTFRFSSFHILGNSSEDRSLQLEWDYGEEWPSGKKWSALSQNGCNGTTRLVNITDPLIENNPQVNLQKDRHSQAKAALKTKNHICASDVKICAEKLVEIAHNYQYQKITTDEKKLILKRLASEIMASYTDVPQFVYPLQLIRESSDSNLSQAVPPAICQYDVQRCSKNGKLERFLLCHGPEKLADESHNYSDNVPSENDTYGQLGACSPEQATVIVLVPRHDNSTQACRSTAGSIPLSQLHAARPIPLALPFARLHSNGSPSPNKSCRKEIPYIRQRNIGDHDAFMDFDHQNATSFMTPQHSIKRSDTTSTKQSSAFEYCSAADCYPSVNNIDWFSVSNVDSFQDETDATDYQSVYSWDTVIDGGEWKADSSAFPVCRRPRGSDKNSATYRGTLSFASIHSDELDVHVFGPEQKNTKQVMKLPNAVEKCELWLRNTPNIAAQRLGFHLRSDLRSLDVEQEAIKKPFASRFLPSTSKDNHSETSSMHLSQEQYLSFNDDVAPTLPNLKTYTLQSLIDQGEHAILKNLPVPVGQNSLIIIPESSSNQTQALNEADVAYRFPQTTEFMKQNDDPQCTRCFYSCHEMPCHYEHLSTPRRLMAVEDSTDAPIFVSFPDNGNQMYKLLPVNVQCDDTMKKAVQKLIFTDFLSVVPNSPECKTLSESLEVILHRTESSENQIRAICGDPEMVSSSAENVFGGSDALKKSPGLAEKRKADSTSPIRIVKSLDSAKSTMTDELQIESMLAEPSTVIPAQHPKELSQEEAPTNGKTVLKSDDSMFTMAGSLLDMKCLSHRSPREGHTRGGNAECLILPPSPVADKVISTHSGPFSSPGQHYLPMIISPNMDCASNNQLICQPECADCVDGLQRKSAGAQVKIPSPKMVGVDCCCQTVGELSPRKCLPPCTCTQSMCTCVQSCSCAHLIKRSPQLGVDCSSQTSARRVSPVLQFSSDHESADKCAFKSCIQVPCPSSEECSIEPNIEDEYHDAIETCTEVTRQNSSKTYNPCHIPGSSFGSQRKQCQPNHPGIPLRLPISTDDSHQPAGHQPSPDYHYPPWNGMYCSPIALQLPVELIAAMTSNAQKDARTTCQTTQTNQPSPLTPRKLSSQKEPENNAEPTLNDLSRNRNQEKTVHYNAEAIKFQETTLETAFSNPRDEKYMCLSMNVQKGGEWSVVKNAGVKQKVPKHQPTSILRGEFQVSQTDKICSLSPKWVDEYDKLLQQRKSSSAMISRGSQCNEECLRSMGGTLEVATDPETNVQNAANVGAANNSAKRNQTPILRLVFASSDESDVEDKTNLVKSGKSKKRMNNKPASASSNYITVDDSSPAGGDQHDEFLQMLLKLYKELSTKGPEKCSLVQSSTTDTSIVNYKFQNEPKRNPDSPPRPQLRQSSGGDWKGDKDCRKKLRHNTTHFWNEVFKMDLPLPFLGVYGTDLVSLHTTWNAGQTSYGSSATIALLTTWENGTQKPVSLATISRECRMDPAGSDKPFMHSRPGGQTGISVINRASPLMGRSSVNEASSGPSTAPPPFHRAKVYPRPSSSWGGLETLLDRLTPMKRAEEVSGDGTFRPKTAPTRPRCCYTGGINIRGNSCYSNKNCCNQNCGELGGFTTESTNTATSDISFYCQHPSKLQEAAGDDNILCYGKKQRNNKQKSYNITQ